MEEYKIFNDNVHGHIKVYPLCQMIINTSLFKRLKDVMQLGVLHEVFPTGNHTRFEHSLGVMHLARRLCLKLGASEEDTAMVEIAGLCHDLGHGPCSHLWENFVRLANPHGAKWEHENSSFAIFKLILEERPEIKNLISENNLLFIKELICGGDKKKENAGVYPYSARGPDKFYLYEIISNKVTGLDVDKMDYLLRDAAALRINLKWELERFLEAGEPKLMDFPWGQEDRSIKEVYAMTASDENQNNQNGKDVKDDNKNGVEVKDQTIVKRIAVRDKVVKNLQHLFSDRVDLHANAYQHKTVRMFDLMYTDMWLLADRHIHVMGAKGPLTLSQACMDETALARLTDGWLTGQILNSTKEELKPAREMLKRIQHRRKYHLVGEVVEVESLPDQADVYEKSLKEFANLPEERISSQLVSSDLAVARISFDMGQGRRNPVEKALFYSKGKGGCHLVSPQKLKKICPALIQDQSLYVFCRSEDEKVVKEAERVVENWFKKRGWLKDVEPKSKVPKISN